jgi:hypothetical protein
VQAREQVTAQTVGAKAVNLAGVLIITLSKTRVRKTPVSAEASVPR